MEKYHLSLSRQLQYYKGLAEKAVEQLSEEQLFWQANEASNSMAVLVQHLCGNMLSRFTDFLDSDGEKPWRNRDAEFELHFHSKQEMLEAWEKAWAVVFTAIDQGQDLDKVVYIRNEGHTVLEAFQRQLAHYSYHIGQMVYLAKMIKNADWETLSIAKSKSGEYNAGKFEAPKGIRHFTDNV
jgi:hypothetical protein